MAKTDGLGAGKYFRLVSQRTDQTLVEISDTDVDLPAQNKDVVVRFERGAPRLVGAPRDSQGLVLRFNSDGTEEHYANAVVEENLTGRPRRGLIVGHPENYPQSDTPPG